jgi:hypothetical protein
VRIFRSYRWRRRLIFTAILAAIAGLIALGVHLSTPGNPGNANGPEVPNYSQPKPARFTPAKRRVVRRVLAEFIRTAVARQHVARSWSLAAPSLKAGVTREQWNRGDLPVVPYPALDKGLGKWDFVQYSYTDTIGLEVFLFPKPGSGYSALTADVELVKGHNGRWLVDYWMPKKFHGPPAVAAKAAKPRKAAGKRRHEPNKAKAASEPMPAVKTSRPSRAYWAVPAGILSLIVLVPISLGIGAWYRNRKAERDYARWRGSA